MLNIGVIGMGDVSEVHLSAIRKNPNASLTAVCDIDPSMKKIVPTVPFYTDYREMLQKESLDCVHICLPHYLHYTVTKACAENGVHVLLEKPLARSADEGMDLVKLEEQYKHIKICVCFQNRLDETFVKLKQLVDSGEYGKVIGIKGVVTWYRPKTYYDKKSWRGKMKQSGGGVLINQAIHTIDLMQLIGGEIHTIRGSIDTLFDYGYEVEDTAMANIQFKNGATGLLFATLTYATNSSVELQVHLEKGELMIKDNILTAMNNEGEEKRIMGNRIFPVSDKDVNRNHTKLINHFYSCIMTNSDDYIHAKSAQSTMEIIDAIRLSSEQKQIVHLDGFRQHLKKCKNKEN